MAETAKQMQKNEAGTPEYAERTRARTVYRPQVDILERAHDIIVTADMPGVDAESVDINLEKNVLTIYGRVEDGPSGEGYRPVHVEYGLGDYERAFTLSDDIDRDHIRAAVKNGVLRITLPKAEGAKNRKIAVGSEM